MLGRNARLLASLLAGAAITLAATGCGGSSSSGPAGGRSATIPLKAGEDPFQESLTGSGKHRGGTLTVYSAGDFQHFDPAQSYYSVDYAVDYATQRPLFSYLPKQETTLSPDLASQMPTLANHGIADGGRTVTVHIRPHVYFSPPVDREVTSADVAFAIERLANPNVANPVWSAYFGTSAPSPLVGATDPHYRGGPLAGVRTPDRYTIVFHLLRPGAPLLLGALSLPLSAPLPPEYVAPMDRRNPTTFGTTYMVSSGPYMLQSDRTGRVSGVGYQPGKSATLVRNPRWNPASDFRPAYLDRINFNIGGDANVIGRQVLEGSHAVQLDNPAQSIVKLAYQRYPSQITFTPGAGDHYLALDNHAGPFRNVNLRRAVWAALDREAIVKARGGALVAQPATHFIYPGVSGYAQSGGAAGPAVDYNRNVSGDLTVARKYMRQAGFPSGRYTGSGTVNIVSNNAAAGPAMAEIVNNAMTSLGFHTRVSLVDQSVMYTKYCQVPKQEIDACPTVGWVRDFADPFSVLYPTFYGPTIVPSNNSDFGQVNDPQINAAIHRASLVVNPSQRVAAWAQVDELLVNDAAAVPEDFDNQANIKSADVLGVNDAWNLGTWDLSFTSLR